MPLYSFEALTPEGKTRKDVIEAESLKAARSMLRAQSLAPLQVQAAAAQSGEAQPSDRAGLAGRLFARHAFNAASLAIWTRQLAGLVSSGLPLERALTSLADEAEDGPQHDLVAALRSEVNGGSTFAKALAQYPREFSTVYVAVIGAGEQSGKLGMVLERLADDLEEQEALKAKLMGAALYPAIVTLIAFFIVLFLVTYVVPQVAQVFAGSKRALPLLTVMLIDSSDFLRHYAWTLLLGAAAAVFGFRLAWANAGFRERFDAGWLRLPILGKVARSYNSARFASTLAMLAASGVPILKALQAAAETLSNRAMKADALDAQILVREGAPLAAALAQKKRFPGLLTMFARQGEQTGQLPAMLQRAAVQLGTEVQRRSMQLATALEPLLIVAMGFVVMLIVLAVLLPIIQMNELIR